MNCILQYQTKDPEGRTNDKTKQKSEKHLFFFYCHGIIRPSDIDSVEMRMGHITCGNWIIISIQSILCITT